MTLTPRGRLLTVITVVALAFVAAFVVGRASAGSGSQQPGPTRIVPSTTTLQVHGLTTPATLPALHQKPGAPKPSTPGAGQGTPSPAPVETPSPSVAPKSTPPPSSGGKVIIG
jgi:hypothetical protein